MHLSVGRSVAMVSVATALRNASGFVGHLRVGGKYSAGERSTLYPWLQYDAQVQRSSAVASHQVEVEFSSCSVRPTTDPRPWSTPRQHASSVMLPSSGYGASPMCWYFCTGLGSVSTRKRVFFSAIPGFPELILPGRMRMSGSAQASQINHPAPRTSTVPVLDAQAAELKAERLWGMADARKPLSTERKNGMPEVSQFSGPFSQTANFKLLVSLSMAVRYPSLCLLFVGVS